MTETKTHPIFVVALVDDDGHVSEVMSAYHTRQQAEERRQKSAKVLGFHYVIWETMYYGS